MAYSPCLTTEDLCIIQLQNGNLPSECSLFSVYPLLLTQPHVVSTPPVPMEFFMMSLPASWGKGLDLVGTSRGAGGGGGGGGVLG